MVSRIACGLGHAAGPVFAAGHLALVGADKLDAVGFERGEIALRGGVLPHAHIHRRRGEHLLVGGEQHGGGEIVGQTMRHLGEKVGGRRRDHDQIGLARQTDMPDLGLVLEVEEIGEDLRLGEHRERERRDEFGAAACQDRAHARAPLLQAAHQFEALIGGDAAADDQEDALALHVVSLILAACSSFRRKPESSARSAKERLDPGFRGVTLGAT